MSDVVCRKCEMPLDIGAEFCGNCGTAVDPKHHPAPAHPKTAVAVEHGDPQFNGHATGSLVLGAMALPVFWYFPIAIPMSIAAFTLGLLGRGSNKKTRAVWGMALGALVLVGAIAFFLYYLKVGMKPTGGDTGGF